MQCVDAARTIDELKLSRPTWAEEIRQYERSRREVVHEDLLHRENQITLTTGAIAAKERLFDPVLQRFREDNTETRKRAEEAKDRVGHLNRARDIQIIREQPFDIVSHESKLETIAPGMDPLTLRTTPIAKTFRPPSFNFNIVSNIPLEQHHCAMQQPVCGMTVAPQLHVAGQPPPHEHHHTLSSWPRAVGCCTAA
mmetsp:Transcript_9438/g.13344  ORF Transcript_9438/g.13344 Transcript_9438/m.13344 type:complete len:196 (-) Transcript_9438:67-654(-)